MSSRVELIAATSPRVETIWRRLERAAQPSYFLTWGWIENWLAMIPARERPTLAAIIDDEITGAFFIGARRVVRHHLFPSRTAFVNATGRPDLDELCIEHNGILSARRWQLATLIEAMPHDWDELFLPGIDPDAFSTLEAPAGFRVRLDQEVPAPYVELERVRAAGDYLALLSSNTRAQIRRARRRLEPLTVDVASSIAEAHAYYAELVALHTASWRARGEDGAFADPWFTRFHARLIEQRFATGEIQLVRVATPEKTIGVIYNLIAGGRVLFYQSGFAMFDDAAIKPGLVSHAEAIARCAAAGHVTYDLLAGAGRYKQSLATATKSLLWLRVQRTRLRFAIEDRLRAWRRALSAHPVRAP